MRDDVAGTLLFAGKFRESPHLAEELHSRIPFLDQIKSRQIKSKQTKSNQNKSSLFKPNQVKTYLINLECPIPEESRHKVEPSSVRVAEDVLLDAV